MPLISSLSLLERRRLLLASGLVAGASLSGCAMLGFGGPATLKANVVAGAQVNPDSRKRPSPVVVRVFELKTSTLFEQADFVSLFEKEQAVLGAELVSREEFVLRPGETKPINKPLSPDTKFIGVMAAFRELERARWRVIVPVAAGKKNVMDITLDDIILQAKRTSPSM